MKAEYTVDYIIENWNTVDTIPLGIPVLMAATGTRVICFGVGIAYFRGSLKVSDVEWGPLIYPLVKDRSSDWKVSYWTHMTPIKATIKLEL